MCPLSTPMELRHAVRASMKTMDASSWSCTRSESTEDIPRTTSLPLLAPLPDGPCLILDDMRSFSSILESHDRKEKLVLGHVLPAGQGEQDGMDVIEILAHHPSTARFISKKLAQRFVADDPPQALVDRMAATFTKTDGDLRAVLETLFSSTEFLSEGAWQAKMKSPLEMVVSAVRALNVDASDVLPFAQRIADIGQPLYGKVEPTGYPNTGESWNSNAGVLGRINFAIALTSGQIAGIRPDVSRFNFKAPAAVAEELLGISPSPETVAAIEKSVLGKEATPSMIAATVLGSPEFQKR